MIEIEKYAQAAASTARTPPNSPARRAALEAENAARVAAEQFVKGLEAERDELRARLAEIEAQEPVLWSYTTDGPAKGVRHYTERRAVAMTSCKPGSLTPFYASPVPAQAVPDVTNAACDVLAERRRQVSAEGYDHQHDDAHTCDEIAAAACFYAMPPGAREWDTSSTGYGDTLGDAIVPDGWVLPAGSRRRDLVKAGALILAEIERMDRAAALEVCRG